MDWVTIIWAVVTILGMIFFCFFTSGIEWGIPGSIFEKKSTPEERAEKAVRDRGEIRGGRKQEV